MRAGLVRAAIRASAGVVMFAVPAVALAANAAGWTTANAPDGSYAVDTLCSAAEVDKLKGMPDDAFPGMELKAQSRVVCRSGHYIFVAGVVEAPSAPPGGGAFFDWLENGVRTDKTAEGTPSSTTINGKRAFLNRQENSIKIAQVGFIEVSKTKIVFLAGGSDGEAGSPSIQDQRNVIDQFFGSVKVVGQ